MPYDAVFPYLGLWDLYHAHDGRLVFIVDFQHPSERILSGEQQVVRVEIEKGFVTNGGFCHQRRVPRSQGRLLADVDEIGQLTDRGETAKNITSFLPMKPLFKLRVCVKMVLDCPLARSCDEDDVGNARSGRLLNCILHARLVNDGQHFFRLCFCGGEKPCAEPGNRNNRFPYFGFFHCDCDSDARTIAKKRTFV